VTRSSHGSCHPSWRATTCRGSACGRSAGFGNCYLHPHRCVAFCQIAAVRTPTASIPKGLSASAAHPGAAHPPAPDGPRANATNPRREAPLLVGDGRGVGAGRERAPGPALAGHRGGPRPGARSGTGRPAGTASGCPAPAGAHAGAGCGQDRPRFSDGPECGGWPAPAEPKDSGAADWAPGPSLRAWPGLCRRGARIALPSAPLCICLCRKRVRRSFHAWISPRPQRGVPLAAAACPRGSPARAPPAPDTHILRRWPPWHDVDSKSDLQGTEARVQRWRRPHTTAGGPT
jgi:hypothetical protein